MKHLFFPLIALMSCAIAACDSNSSLCDTDDDCLTLCQAYDGNALLYQCSEGMCQCMAKETIACSGNDFCIELCEKYRPGSVGTCESSECVCTVESDKTDETDPSVETDETDK